jgi:hypothetical protein
LLRLIGGGMETWMDSSDGDLLGDLDGLFDNCLLGLFEGDLEGYFDGLFKGDFDASLDF